jgi:hypothetical protein
MVVAAKDVAPADTTDDDAEDNATDVAEAVDNTDTASTPPLATASVASVIGANSIFALDADTAAPTATADSAEGDTADGDDTADAPPAASHRGWRIQLAAAPSKDNAEEILDRAIAKGGKLLAKAAPYTEPVQTGSLTLYRARFAGFSSKEAARAACAYLATQKFSCLAISD